MGFMDKLKSWWRKDELAEAEEETRMTPAERDVAEEGYEDRKDDVEAAERTPLGLTPGLEGEDFEADSERPR